MGNSTHLGNLAKAEKDGVFDATMAYAWASDATAWEHCIEFAGVNEANAHAVLEMIQQLEEAGFSRPCLRPNSSGPVALLPSGVRKGGFGPFFFAFYSAAEQGPCRSLWAALPTP